MSEYAWPERRPELESWPFKRWLQTKRAGDNSRGDFLRDFRRDKDFPLGRTWEEVHFYMWQRGACLEAREEAEKLWKEYCRKFPPFRLYGG